MNLIMAPFNGLYFICWGITIALIVAIGLIFKDKSEKAKTVFIVSFCLFTAVLFFIYKGFLSVDKDFLNKTVPKLTKFNWFNELPLQLCNINMFLIPIGVLTKKRGIMGFSFFLAPLGASMALFFPEAAFVGEPLLLPRMLGYYVTHYFIVISGISLATLGFFRPKFKDFPRVFLTLISLSFFIHCINLILRATGLCTYANYFFTMDDAGISILALFHKFIKVPYLYMLPSLLILAVYMAIISLVFFIIGKFKSHTNEKTEDEKELVNV